MMSYKGHHPSFISLYSFFFGSPHTALGMFWSADMDIDEVMRGDGPGCTNMEKTRKERR